MRNIICFFLLLQGGFCVAQDFTMPLNEATGKIVFKGDVTVSNSKRDDTYTKARMWVGQIVGKDGAITMEERASGIIVASSFRLVAVQGKTKKQQMNFTITLTITDEKVKYSVSDISFQSYGTKTIGMGGYNNGGALATSTIAPQPCEEIYEKYLKDRKKGVNDIDTRKYYSYLEQADNATKLLIADLKVALGI